MPQALTPARQVALDTLNAVLARRNDLQYALDQQLKRAQLEPRDIALATELAYGATRQWIRLTRELAQYLKDASTIPPNIFTTLHLALYELWFLDRIPNYASIHWAVEYAKSQAGKGLAKMANAILRRLDRVGPSYDPRDAHEDEPVETLAARFALPEWLLSMWIDQFGVEQALEFARLQLQAPGVGIRVNAKNPEANKLAQRLQALPGCDADVDFDPLALTFSAGHRPQLSRELTRGLVSYQSIAAQQMMHALRCSEWREPILDACAGHGGKSCALLERGKQVVSMDRSFSQLRSFRREVKRLGLGSCLAARGDSTAPYPFNISFRTILLDAPCSGFGVLSRRPDIKLHRNINDVRQLTDLQDSLLKQAWEHVLPGGEVIYMTCTINTEENEERIDAFLAQFSNAHLEQMIAAEHAQLCQETFFACRIRKS